MIAETQLLYQKASADQHIESALWHLRQIKSPSEFMSAFDFDEYRSVMDFLEQYHAQLFAKEFEPSEGLKRDELSPDRYNYLNETDSSLYEEVCQRPEADKMAQAMKLMLEDKAANCYADHCNCVY